MCSRISRAHEFVRERFPNELTEKEAWHAALDVWIAAQREQVREEARVYCPELTPRRLRVLPYIAVIALTAVVAHFALRPKSEPYVHPAQHELRSAGSRGGHVTRPALDLPAGEERSLIRVVLSEAPHDRAYRIEIADESKTIWTSEVVQPDGDRAFALSLPRGFLRAGNYRLLVFGVDDSGSHLREAYAIRVH